MSNFEDTLMLIAMLIRRYSVYYFSITGLFLVIMLGLLVRNKYSKRFTINKIKRLLTKKPDKALKKISKSDLDVIEYFLKGDNLSSDKQKLVVEYLSQVEQVREIYLKIIYSKNNKDRESNIKTGISVLSSISTPQAIDYLVNFLYEKNPDVIKIVLAELSAKKKDKVIYSLIDYIRYIEDSGMLSYLKDIFQNMGPAAANKLIPFIFEAEPTIKIFFIDIIGEQVNDEIYQVLTELLADENSEVKIHAMQKLSNYNLKDELFDKIIGLLEDKHWGVRSQAIQLLGGFKTSAVAPYLAKRMTDESGVVRVAATEALLDLGYDGIKYIFELAKRPEAPKEIKEALKKQDIAFLIEALEHVCQDENQEKTVNQEFSY